MVAPEVLRDLFFWQATEMEAAIKSQCRQADEFWAYISAIDAILMGCQGVSKVTETLLLPRFDIVLAGRGGGGLKLLTV
jgi:hypothetical protein